MRCRSPGRSRRSSRRSSCRRACKLICWYDQSQLVTQSVASVRDAVLIGLVLAAIVLLLFLRSWRVTLIAVIVVPATLAATVLVLSLLGMSFNIMTLGGIAAAVGLLIDDVIVMVEHIARRAGARRTAERATARPATRAVLPAAREFMTPLTGSSLATLIVFLPLSLPDRRDRRLLQGAVDDDGGGAGDLLGDDRLRRAAAGAPAGRFRTVARSRRAGRRLAGARATTALLDGLLRRPWLLARGRWCRCWSLGYVAYAQRADRLHAQGRRGRLRDGLLHPPGTSLIETEPRDRRRSMRCCAPIPKSRPSRAGSAPGSAAISARAITATTSCG